MIRGATYMVAVTPDHWDTHPYLFNCRNGTLELDTMTFRDHHRDDHLTKVAGVNYDPDAECPMWEEHIDLIFQSDYALIEGFQEICGYSLMHGNPEQVMFILYGTGKNGKNVTMDTLARIFGDYAVNIAAESLMLRRNNEGPRSDLARMVGARFVTSSEPSAGKRLAETVVKQLTGDDKVTVRRLYENEFEFQPGGKIWLATNYKIPISGTDEGIWRRIWMVPFTYTIPEENRIMDYVNVLQAEGPGILNWCLEGYARWQARGRLEQPAAVTRATSEYRQENDTVAAWLLDTCVLDYQCENEFSRPQARDSYEKWCMNMGETPVSARALASELRDRGCTDGKTVSGVRFWNGIRLKTTEEAGGS